VASWIKLKKELQDEKDLIVIKMEGAYYNVDEPSVQMM